jgi:chromosome segregation ATPase
VGSVSTEAQVDVKNLKRMFEEKDGEIDNLQQEIQSLELQLSRAKLAVANNVLSAQPTPETSQNQEFLSKAREELKAKRIAETALQQLLRDTQTRFNSLQQDSLEIAQENSQLQGHDSKMRDALTNREAKVVELDSEVKVLRGELAKKDVEHRALEMHEASDGDHNRIRELRNQLAKTEDQLKAKKDSERALNRSLREALGLLKPLQMHLEEAEHEKREIANEMRALRQRMGDAGSVRSVGHNKTDMGRLSELEDTVKHLETENSQLHDCLEDMSQSMNASGFSGMSNKTDSKLREEFVEMKSRYEVTKGRLEDAYVENQTLVEGLRTRDAEENAMVEELHVLRDHLKQSELELENAKFIATSALVKVEELTMANVEQLSLNSETIYKEKARELENEMRSARQQHGKVPYRLT